MTPARTSYLRAATVSAAAVVLTVLLPLLLISTPERDASRLQLALAVLLVLAVFVSGWRHADAN